MRWPGRPVALRPRQDIGALDDGDAYLTLQQCARFELTCLKLLLRKFAFGDVKCSRKQCLVPAELDSRCRKVQPSD